MSSAASVRSVASLREELERHYHAFNREDAATDPVELVRPFADPADREIAGFCAAALAFGRIASVLNSIRALFRVMGPHPAAFARRFDPSRDSRAFDGLVHRWTRGRDLAALVWILRAMLERSGSVEAFFLEGLQPGHDDVGPALDSFSRRARAIDLRPVYTLPRAGSRGSVPKRPGVHYFFPCPSSGSGCKRLNLFVRWMVRRDQVDLGVWTRVPAAKLIVPLDTHVIRLGRCLRLTRYASPGWKMAAEITASLRVLDPADPVKFDFSLCHLGMMNACGYGRPQRDSQCPLRGICRPRPKA
ncbi:MAG: TIGR02757 family protein [Vicinamibacterales bacterium]